MRELTIKEIGLVSGGVIDPMDVAIGYSSGAVSMFVGFTIAGPVGGIVGAVAGFTLGMTASIGYSLATSPGGMYRDDGMACHMAS
jgi:hypothetical protein